jgi:cytochrome c peroxidase
MMLKKRYPFYFLFIIVGTSCKVDPKISTPLPANNLAQVIPDGWPGPQYRFEENPITEDKFILGRWLFYENMLSKDNTISCGSCHQNFVAFGNADHQFSHGINGIFGKRNSPGIFNLAWHPYFMHDGGISHIELQPLGPISNPIEMAENINEVLERLKASEKYRTLFKNAYGDEEINSERMLKSIAQFMGLINSSNSKFDKYKRDEGNTQLTEAESRGYDIFKGKCNACHTEPLFSDFKMRSNGIEVDPLLNDSGRAHITSLPEDRYKFKTPSLRNVALTYPYMHDGRYKTLEDCLDHYNTIKNTVNLDPLLQNGIPLSTQEKQDILAFLNTLTDFELIKDKRFSDPNFN